MHRLLLVLVLGAAPWLTGCLGGDSGASGASSSATGVSSAAEPAPTLRIVVHRYGGRPKIARSWTLGCEPPRGSSPHPAASCAALRDFLTHPHRQKHVCLCPVILPGSLYATIDGTLDGKPLGARLGICLTCGLSGRAVRDLRAATGLHSFTHL